MSNGIYNILGKLQALEPKQEQQPAAQTQPLYESVEAKGSILEGVAKVEAELTEKYMGFKKVAAAAAAGGAKDPDAVAASIGRKKYGKEKFQKAAAAGKKLGESADLEKEYEDLQKKKTQLVAKLDRLAEKGTQQQIDGLEEQISEIVDRCKALRKQLGINESEKADKDYDGDGKIESPKDEVWG